jgi:hypothetical protein
MQMTHTGIGSRSSHICHAFVVSTGSTDDKRGAP